MKPPICRLCKNAHWARDRHVWDEVPVTNEEWRAAADHYPEMAPGEMAGLSPVDPKELAEWSLRAAKMLGPAAPEALRNNAPGPSRRKPDTSTKAGDHLAAALPAAQQSCTQSPDKPDTAPSSAPKFDRNAYQREYMRKWRADHPDENRKRRKGKQ
jgi:hypothetical protein